MNTQRKKKYKKEHWREVENGDYVEKKKAHLMKFVWRDWERGEAKIPSHYSTRRLCLHKTVVSHCWPFTKCWVWIKAYCYLFWLRLYVVMYQTNKQFITLYLPRITDRQQRESPELSPLRRIPAPTNCKSRWPLQETWPQMKFRREVWT